MTENLYCKIFINTILEYDNFFESVKNFLNGQKKAISFIESEWCSMDIRRNKEYIPQSPDFLYWKFIINIEPQKNIAVNTYKDNIIQFVDFLKHNHKVICACDFEEIFVK